MLLVYKFPVPNPCGILVLSVATHCAIAFKPILDSNADVAHHPIEFLFAKFIHSYEP